MHLDEIPEEELQWFLAQEWRDGRLWRRRFQIEALTGAAVAPGVFEVLEQATLAGELDRAWLEGLFATQRAPVLVGLAQRRLEIIVAGKGCTPLGALLIERVAEMLPVSSTLAETATRVLSSSSCVIDDRLVVALLQMIAGLDRQRVLAVLSGQWPAICGLGDGTARDRLLQLFSQVPDGALLPTDLLDHRGKPIPDWLLCGRWARRMLTVPGFVDALAACRT